LTAARIHFFVEAANAGVASRGSPAFKGAHLYETAFVLAAA
jgi:hypothetical protein